jgi:hypothetical protein
MGFVTLEIGVLVIELRRSIESVLFTHWSNFGIFVDDVMFRYADNATSFFIDIVQQTGRPPVLRFTLLPVLAEEIPRTEKFKTEESDTVFLVSRARWQVPEPPGGLCYLYTMKARKYWARTMLRSLLIIDNLPEIALLVLLKANISIIPPTNTSQKQPKYALIDC